MSLRARLLLGLGLVAALLVAVAVLVTRTTRADLIEKVDEQLLVAVRDVRVDGPFGSGTRPPITRGELRGPGGPSPYWVGAIDGTEVTTLALPRTAQSDDAVPRFSDADVDALLAEPGRGVTVPGEGVDRFRVVGRPAQGHDAVLVAAPLDDVDSSVRRLVLVEVVATTLVLAVLALVAFWVLRLGLRPLKRMTATATAIGDGDLSHRVPDADPRTEAGELGAALNRMLAHIEGAFAERAASEDRLRRFVADASHELRTPITTIRGYAELHRRGGLDDPADLDAALRRTEQEATRMGALVDDLLLLARLDQGRPLERSPVDLSVLARDAAADTRAAHDDRTVHLQVPGPAVVVVGDEHRLRQVLANLLANAVDHTPSEAAVTVTVDSVDRPGEPGHVRLQVTDDGPGMDPVLAERAFERFTRGDASRSRRSGGSGLGLSIVAAIVEAHEGRVSLTTTPGAGTTVTVELPGA